VQSACTAHSGLVSLREWQRLSAPQMGSCESKPMHWESSPVGQGMRQAPSRQTEPEAQSESMLQKGLGVRSGRQKPSAAQVSPAAQSVLVVQPGRQRVSTQLSLAVHWLVRVQVAVVRQNPL